jgi:hypothetical protein
MGMPRFFLAGQVVFLAGLSCVFGADASVTDGSDIPEKLMAFEAIVAEDRAELFAQDAATSTNAPISVPSLTNAAPGKSSGVQRPPMTKKQKFMQAMTALKINATRGEYTYAILSAESLALVDKSAAAQAALKDLITEFQALRSAQEAEAAKDVNKVLADATTAVLAAKDAKDLDATLMEIGEAMGRNHHGAFISANLVDADHFVKDWQTYLFDKTAGDKSNCLFDLKGLCSMGSTFRPIPRSQLLQLYQQAQDDTRRHP